MSSDTISRFVLYAIRDTFGDYAVVRNVINVAIDFKSEDQVQTEHSVLIYVRDKTLFNHLDSVNKCLAERLHLGIPDFLSDVGPICVGVKAISIHVDAMAGREVCFTIRTSLITSRT